MRDTAYYEDINAAEVAAVGAVTVDGADVENTGSTCYGIFGTLPSGLGVYVSNGAMDGQDDGSPFSVGVYLDAEQVTYLTGELAEQLDRAARLSMSDARTLLGAAVTELPRSE
jgi:hypothetical protein